MHCISQTALLALLIGLQLSSSARNTVPPFNDPPAPHILISGVKIIQISTLF